MPFLLDVYWGSDYQCEMDANGSALTTGMHEGRPEAGALGDAGISAGRALVCCSVFGIVLLKLVLIKDDGVMAQADREGGDDKGRRLKTHCFVPVRGENDPSLRSVWVLQVQCPFWTHVWWFCCSHCIVPSLAFPGGGGEGDI